MELRKKKGVLSVLASLALLGMSQVAFAGKDRIDKPKDIALLLAAAQRINPGVTTRLGSGANVLLPMKIKHRNDLRQREKSRKLFNRCAVVVTMVESPKALAELSTNRLVTTQQVAGFTMVQASPPRTPTPLAVPAPPTPEKDELCSTVESADKENQSVYVFPLGSPFDPHL